MSNELTQNIENDLGSQTEDVNISRKIASNSLIREDAVLTAIQFLSNSKVRESPLNKKVTFLEKKGLNSQEIKEALIRAESLKETETIAPELPRRPLQYDPSMDSSSISSRTWKNTFSPVLLIGGFTYGVFLLCRKYLWPNVLWLTRSETYMDGQNLGDFLATTREDINEKTKSFNELMMTLKQEINQTREIFSPLEESLDQLHQKQDLYQKEITDLRKEMDNLCEILPKLIETNREEYQRTLHQLSNDVKSLKSILLSHKQFPPPISTTSNHSPIKSAPQLPSWQLSMVSETEKSSKNHEIKIPAVSSVSIQDKSDHSPDQISANSS
jgi:peroxin-14